MISQRFSGLRVCHISMMHQPFDTRIFQKECISLAKEGFSPVYLFRGDDSTEQEGVRLTAIKGRPNSNRLLLFPLLYRRLYRKAKSLKAAVYHIHDPELLPLGVMLKLFTGSRIIFDAHEFYADQILGKRWMGPPRIRRAVSRIYRILEKGLLLFYDGIVTATEGIAHNYRKGKTYVVRNFPVKALIDAIPQTIEKKSKPVIMYPGSLTESRGILKLIEAVELLGGEAELWLAGRFPDTSFERRCKRHPGWKHTRYFGYLTYDSLYPLVKSSDIGLQLVLPLNNYQKGQYPVKVFEFMASGKPLVMSNRYRDLPPFTECSLFADPFDPGDIASTVRRLLSDKALCRELGGRGREMVDRYYSWEREQTELLSCYAGVLK